MAGVQTPATSSSDAAGRRSRWALVTLLSALALVAGGVLTAIGVAHAAAPSTQIIQPRRAFGTGPLREVLARAKGPQPRLTVLGDSVPAGTACDCDPFGTLLAHSLADGRGAPVALLNASTPGQTTSGLLQQVSSGSLDASLADTNVVTVTIGANDFDDGAIGDTGCDDGGRIDCYNGDLAQFRTTITRLLQSIDSRLPAGARLEVTGYWNVFRDGAVGQSLGQQYVQTSDALTRAINTAIAAASRNAGGRYVDIYTPFESVPLATLTSLLAPDGDHPSAAGHQLIARTLLPFAAQRT